MGLQQSNISKNYNMNPEFVNYIEEYVLLRQCSLKAFKIFKQLIKSCPTGCGYAPPDEEEDNAPIILMWDKIVANIQQNGEVFVFFTDEKFQHLSWYFSDSDQACQLISKLLEFVKTKNDIDFSRDVVDIQKFSSVCPELHS